MVALTELQPKCIFVVGPTASGKSAWALKQAERTGGCIINIDSVQFYEGLLIGSAAPTESEKKQVPHYLYSYVSAPTEMTAGRYLTDFYSLLNTGIRGPIFIVGGTGFYIQALEKGMFNVPAVPDEVRKKIEAELKVDGAEKLFTELKSKDPDSKIHMNDHFRLVRALEIIRHTGEIPSLLKARPQDNKHGLPFASIKVGFDFEKSIFEKRVQARTEKMISDGIIEETSSFLQRGFADWSPLQSVGYRETAQFISENLSREWLSEAVSRSTMQLIKKQKTWFKRDKTILWSNGNLEIETLLQKKLDQFLS